MTTHTSFFPKLTDRVTQSLRFSIIKENQLEISKAIAVIRTVTQIRDRNERKREEDAIQETIYSIRECDSIPCIVLPKR